MSMGWLAVELEPAAGSPLAAATGRAEDGAEWFLSAWSIDARPPGRVSKVSLAVVDPDGPPGPVSLVRAPRGVRVIFDDPAVAQARRDVLAGPSPRFVSTLVRGDSIFDGAVTGLPGGPHVDPFARVLPALTLHVGPGLFVASAPPPTGPVTERYGGGQPWPIDRFPDAAGSVSG
ncbi:MAG: hypothetical protein ACR2N6_04465 [Miltoncostaeaceae bacterium]